MVTESLIALMSLHKRAKYCEGSVMTLWKVTSGMTRFSTSTSSSLREKRDRERFSGWLTSMPSSSLLLRRTYMEMVSWLLELLISL